VKATFPGLPGQFAQLGNVVLCQEGEIMDLRTQAIAQAKRAYFTRSGSA